MKKTNKRFEITYTQDDTVTCYHVILDTETKREYLWIVSEQGMSLTTLQSNSMVKGFEKHTLDLGEE